MEEKYVKLIQLLEEYICDIEESCEKFPTVGKTYAEYIEHSKSEPYFEELCDHARCIREAICAIKGAVYHLNNEMNELRYNNVAPLPPKWE